MSSRQRDKRKASGWWFPSSIIVVVLFVLLASGIAFPKHATLRGAEHKIDYQSTWMALFFSKRGARISQEQNGQQDKLRYSYPNENHDTRQLLKLDVSSSAATGTLIRLLSLPSIVSASWTIGLPSCPAMMVSWIFRMASHWTTGLGIPIAISAQREKNSTIQWNTKPGREVNGGTNRSETNKVSTLHLLVLLIRLFVFFAHIYWKLYHHRFSPPYWYKICVRWACCSSCTSIVSESMSKFRSSKQLHVSRVLLKLNGNPKG